MEFALGARYGIFRPGESEIYWQGRHPERETRSRSSRPTDRRQVMKTVGIAVFAVTAAFLMSGCGTIRNLKSGAPDI